jgi:osmoprotectant transport system substrate-binding protein
MIACHDAETNRAAPGIPAGRWVKRRHRRPHPDSVGQVTVHLRGLLLALGLVALLASGCGSSNPLGGGAASGDLKTIVVGSADFPESKILAEIYAQALEANGFTVGRQFGIGSRETYIPALQDHSIDLIPEYTGNLLRYFDPDTTASGSDAVELALTRALPGDLSMLTPSPASDTDTVAVTKETAQEWNLTSIGDLAPHSAQVKFGAPSEFLHRPEGLPGLKSNYGLDITAKNFVAISDGGGPATVRALVDGTVTAADIFSTSPAIAQNDLVVLEDPKNNFLAANVVPVLSSQKKSDELKRILDAVSARLTTEALIELNTAVSGNAGVDPDEAARKWLSDNGFVK